MEDDDPAPFVLRVRNDPLGFAQRTLKNFRNIEEGYKNGADVHVVTQLMISLLGVVVFPWEKRSFETLRTLRIGVSLCGAQKYQWNITKDTYEGAERCDSIGVLLNRLRNATSHGRVIFSSDSRDIQDVSITFSDRRPRDKQTYYEWSADITAADLREFCVGLLNTMWID
jgi:hypothetical protein